MNTADFVESRTRSVGRLGSSFICRIAAAKIGPLGAIANRSWIWGTCGAISPVHALDGRPGCGLRGNRSSRPRSIPPRPTRIHHPEWDEYLQDVPGHFLISAARQLPSSKTCRYFYWVIATADSSRRRRGERGLLTGRGNRRRCIPQHRHTSPRACRLRPPKRTRSRMPPIKSFLAAQCGRI